MKACGEGEKSCGAKVFQEEFIRVMGKVVEEKEGDVKVVYQVRERICKALETKTSNAYG